ncbi:MAG: nitroreductase [Oscillospiraceae bacterium]|jgi:nitroreductase|nr:nitroreductase [Oscillospiraceae bacterium]MCI9669244.1 nitroreductase [Oscillospiraceae bacterium]
MGIFMDLIKCRYSCRKYDSRPVEREKIQACIEAARLAPSACNSQPWYFAAVCDWELARKIGATTQQYEGINRFADQPPVFITVWEDVAQLMPQISGDLDSQHYAPGDVGMAVSYLTLAAADMGLGTCIMGIFDEAVIRDLLHVPQEKKLRYVVAVGYPGAGSRIPEKGRKPLEEISKIVG